MSEWHDVAGVDDVSDGEVLGVAAGNVPVALFCVGDAFFALHDLCSHGAARLSDGYVDGDCIECPLHQGLVSIRTGKPKSAPITDPVASYPTRIVDGRIEVEIP